MSSDGDDAPDRLKELLDLAPLPLEGGWVRELRSERARYQRAAAIEARAVARQQKQREPESLAEYSY